MILETEVRVASAVVFVMDPGLGIPPDVMNSAAVAFGESSVAVGTLAGADGPTRMWLSLDSAPPCEPGLTLRWEGALASSGRLGVVSIEVEVLLELAVSGPVDIQVWTNHESEPDAIWVGVSSDPAPNGD